MIINVYFKNTKQELSSSLSFLKKLLAFEDGPLITCFDYFSSVLEQSFKTKF